VKIFAFAILIVSKYDKKPSRSSYWDSGADLPYIAVYEAARRDRFVAIMRYLHCADKTQSNLNEKINN
jgi:hypothetical protein